MKATHLELLSDLTSDALIATLKRFTSRRGVRLQNEFGLDGGSDPRREGFSPTVPTVWTWSRGWDGGSDGPTVQDENASKDEDTIVNSSLFLNEVM
ncbi:hypothetical protein TNCV_718401 [Trichonephila clavipes]|nr:hypothetical protein TNCV_718401 [Trichonephila clavipes]